jgi:hypothetical protein
LRAWRCGLSISVALVLAGVAFWHWHSSVSLIETLREANSTEIQGASDVDRVEVSAATSVHEEVVARTDSSSDSGSKSALVSDTGAHAEPAEHPGEEFDPNVSTSTTDKAPEVAAAPVPVDLLAPESLPETATSTLKVESATVAVTIVTATETASQHNIPVSELDILEPEEGGEDPKLIIPGRRKGLTKGDRAEIEAANGDDSTGNNKEWETEADKNTFTHSKVEEDEEMVKEAPKMRKRQNGIKRKTVKRSQENGDNREDADASDDDGKKKRRRENQEDHNEDMDAADDYTRNKASEAKMARNGYDAGSDDEKEIKKRGRRKRQKQSTNAGDDA